MESETTSMLCNPTTHAPLRLVRSQTPDGAWQEFLEDVHTGEKFPFRDGIPVLYDASRLEGYNLRYNAFYRRAARIYDFALGALALLSGSREARFRQQYLQKLEIREGSRVLEVSVGTGANLPLLPESARRYGLDLSWEMLAQCQKNLRRWGHTAELFYGNAEQLPFHDGMFDAVFHVGGINAFSDRARAICEMIRVAKPGTRIVIVDESSKLMKAMSWMPSARKMVEEWGDRFDAPVSLVPSEMREIQVDAIVKGYFYVLSFRTP